MLFAAKPKKPKKKREVRGYTPPRELSIFGIILLMGMGVLMVLFFLVNMAMGIFGDKALGTPYTRLLKGEVVPQDYAAVSSTLFYTFTDKNGVLREGNMNLLGNSEKIGETVNVSYFAAFPQWNMLASRAENNVAQLGCLALGFILFASGEARLKEKRRAKEAAAEAAATEQPAIEEPEAEEPEIEGSE